MCILSGSPERVSKTQILAFHAADGRHQVTVYANEVRLARRISTTYVPWGEPGGGGDGNDVAECAMVLPFPAGGACEMIDTTSSKGLFAALNDLFPGVLSYSLGSRGGFGVADGATLEVKSCGSYDYSVAPTVDDLSRLDASLRIGDVMDLLRRVYGTGFSFLVCGIRKSAQYHPIAYRHALRSDGRLFLPTLHEHGPAAHAHGPMWDHVIFSLRQGHPQSQSQQAGYVSEDYDARPPWLEEETIEKSKEVGVSWQEVAKAVGPALAKHLTSGTNGATLKKITLVGNHPNQDMLIKRS